MRKKLLLGIDYKNILISSFYGEPLINSYGMNVNAIKSFFFKIKMLKDALEPDCIFIADDVTREKTFRRQLYKHYKAQRKPLDPQITNQIKPALQIASLLGYPILCHELYEADDIMGMISTYATEQDIDLIIASSDRDLYQLINKNTFVFSPRGRDIIDLDYMKNNYKVTPKEWIEIKMLEGDRSDNIPGIDGVGKVTALSLIQQFKSVDGVYENLKNLKPALQHKLLEGQERMGLVRQLVTILTDYNLINFKPELLNRGEIHRNEIYECIDKLEIPTLYDVMNYSLLKEDVR